MVHVRVAKQSSTLGALYRFDLGESPLREQAVNQCCYSESSVVQTGAPRVAPSSTDTRPTQQEYTNRMRVPQVGTGRRHGRYRGWVQTDQDGRYEFKTVRPGGYPNSDLPEHIHLHVLEPGCATYYLEDATFDDDPRLTEAKRREFANHRGGKGLSSPKRVLGVWQAQRNITLGQSIPDYPGCK